MKVNVYFMGVESESSIYSNEFYVKIRVKCESNLQTIQPIQNVYYEVSDPEVTFQINEWTSSVVNCGALNYEATLANGMELPNFINFSQTTRDFNIKTNQTSDVGFHSIKVLGTTGALYVDTSQIVTTFIILVKCVVKRLLPKNSYFTKSYFIGAESLLEVPINAFDTYPKCKGD